MILRLVFLLTLIAATPLLAADLVPGPVPARVVRVVDGDTLAVRALIWPGHEVRVLVRLRGIDAPELRARCDGERAMAMAASAALAALADDAEIRLHDIQGDKYFGRVVADVRLADGRDLGALMLATALARPYDGRARASWCAESPQS